MPPPAPAHPLVLPVSTVSWLCPPSCFFRPPLHLAPEELGSTLWRKSGNLLYTKSGSLHWRRISHGAMPSVLLSRTESSPPFLTPESQRTASVLPPRMHRSPC